MRVLTADGNPGLVDAEGAIQNSNAKVMGILDSTGRLLTIDDVEHLGFVIRVGEASHLHMPPLL